MAWEFVSAGGPLLVASLCGSGFVSGQRSSDVMSNVYEAAESLGSCSLSLNYKINMYLPHIPRPQATCTRFPLIYPPPASITLAEPQMGESRKPYYFISSGEEATAGIKLQ